MGTRDQGIKIQRCEFTEAERVTKNSQVRIGDDMPSPNTVDTWHKARNVYLFVIHNENDILVHHIVFF